MTLPATEFEIDRNSPTPAYEQVRQRLRGLIAGWRDHTQRFYGDEALSAMFGVSRLTVRRAVDDLVEERYLVRKRGVGTFVIAEKVEEQLNAEADFFRQWARAGRELVARVELFEIRPAPTPVAEILEIEPGSPIAQIERIRSSDGQAAAFDIRYLPEALAQTLSPELIERRSLVDHLRQRHALAAVDYWIEAIQAGSDERALRLGLLPGDPALVRRLCYRSVEGRPLMCGVSFYRADQIRFAITLPFDTGRKTRSTAASIDLVHEYRS
jgi:GntR family transcriptional regulator